MNKLLSTAMLAASLLTVVSTAEARVFKTGMTGATRCAAYKQDYINDLRSAKLQKVRGNSVGSAIAAGNAVATRETAAKNCIAW